MYTNYMNKYSSVNRNIIVILSSEYTPVAVTVIADRGGRPAGGGRRAAGGGHGNRCSRGRLARQRRFLVEIWLVVLVDVFLGAVQRSEL